MSKKEQPDYSRFQPTEFPFAHLLTVFAVPALVVIIPMIIDRTNELKDLMIIALVVFGISMFVMWLITYMHVYNESYERQIQGYKLEQAKDTLEVIKEELDRVKNEVYELKIENSIMAETTNEKGKQ